MRRHGLRTLGGEGNFTGKPQLPLPETFSGNPADWEEWAWNFTTYISMSETGAVTLLDNAERRTDVFFDKGLNLTLDTGDIVAEQAAARLLYIYLFVCLFVCLFMYLYVHG